MPFSRLSGAGQIHRYTHRYTHTGAAFFRATPRYASDSRSVCPVSGLSTSLIMPGSRVRVPPLLLDKARSHRLPRFFIVRRLGWCTRQRTHLARFLSGSAAIRSHRSRLSDRGAKRPETKLRDDVRCTAHTGMVCHSCPFRASVAHTVPPRSARVAVAVLGASAGLQPLLIALR